MRASHSQTHSKPCPSLQSFRLRLVFTSHGVVVRVVIRGVARYDLVKIKPTESEAEHWFCLWLRRLWSSENCIVRVASRSGRMNQWQCSTPGLAIGWFFRFCFRLRQLSFHWIISDGVVNGIRRNGNVLTSDSDSDELMTPTRLWLRSDFRLRFRRAYDSAYDSDFRFSLGHKLPYDSDYDSDSVASENQP